MLGAKKQIHNVALPAGTQFIVYLLKVYERSSCLSLNLLEGGFFVSGLYTASAKSMMDGLDTLPGRGLSLNSSLDISSVATWTSVLPLSDSKFSITIAIN